MSIKIDPKTVTIVALIAALGYDARVSRKNRKLYESLNADYRRAADLANLYADKLNREKIPLDDYTRFIMEELTLDQ